MSRNRKSIMSIMTFALLVLGSFVALRSARGDGTSASPAEVKIDNFTFQKPTITVPVGTQVTWVNRDDIPHTVVSDDKVFKSKALETDEKFTFTFSQAGTYHYFCSIHPKMTAEIVVK